MKKTPMERIPFALPAEFERLVSGVKIYDSSCSPEAKVYFLDRDGGYYLKISPAGSLATEAQMTSYFHKKGLGVEVLFYASGERDYLLMAAAKGEDCTHRRYLDDPRRLCDTLAEHLRALHELDASDCPVQDRMRTYLALADENYRAGKHDLSLFSPQTSFRTAQEAYAVLEEGREALTSDVLLHGDYCLPNVILDDWRLSAFIDLGNGGVGDRHIDLFWGAWTLWFNLGTDAYKDRFFDAYGRDKIETEKLKIIASAEVFG